MRRGALRSDANGSLRRAPSRSKEQLTRAAARRAARVNIAAALYTSYDADATTLNQFSLGGARGHRATLVVKRDACGKRNAGSACTDRLPSGSTSTAFIDSCKPAHPNHLKHAASPPMAVAMCNIPCKGVKRRLLLFQRWPLIICLQVHLLRTCRACRTLVLGGSNGIGSTLCRSSEQSSGRQAA